ncbi:MAG: lipopolysaccharide kinase InaA family protein [Planctomycetota bacterium]|nr:lipopolysaccharide kinase InaA family protein [Planctomycetota bacterium]MDG1983890.1 lipopolysaccharide kinase InaA family protein [Planctomycetota bacterium]
MGLVQRLPALPNGFLVVEGERGVMACRASHLDPLRTSGFSPDGRHRLGGTAELQDAEESGREPLGALEVGGVRCLARRFSHGGLARFITGRRFKDPSRPFNELILSEALRERGVPTPRVLAARAVPVFPLGFELTLVTERLGSSLDLGHLLGAVRRGERTAGDLRRGLASSGALVRRVHDAGCMHADLQPANILLREGGWEEAWILDLDRSRIEGGGGLPEAARLRNLARLWRHVGRREQEYGPVVGAGGAVRFLKAYGVASGDLRRWLDVIHDQAREGGLLHRAGWRLERTFGRSEDARAASGRP